MTSQTSTANGLNVTVSPRRKTAVLFLLIVLSWLLLAVCGVVGFGVLGLGGLL